MTPLWKFAWAVTPRTPHLIAQILRISRSAKSVSGDASPVAQLLKVIRLDRFARCGLELYDMMAVAEENAGYGDRSAPIRGRSAKFSITALVMHQPIHRSILHPLPATALIQVKRASAWTRSARLTMPTIRPSRSTGTRLMRWAVSSRAIASISVSSPTVTIGAVMTSRARRSGA